MNNRIMRRRKSRKHPVCVYTIIPVYMLVLFVGVQFSQRVLLEAQYNGVGMVAPQGKRLYLRVFDNGNYEFEDQVFGKSPNDFEVRKETLSRSELKELTDRLNDPLIVGLPKEIPPLSEPLDHVIEIKLQICRGDGVQDLLITNFSPNSTGAKDRYPKPLLELLRAIERLRNVSERNQMKNEHLCTPMFSRFVSTEHVKTKSNCNTCLPRSPYG